MHVGAGLRVRCSVCQRPDELLRGAPAAYGFLKIGQAFDKKEWRDVRHVKVVEQNCLVEVQAFQR